MPYGNGPSVKKLSKMSTLLLARNYILNLTKNMEHLKLCVAKVCMEQRKPIPPVVCAGPISGGLLPGSVGLLGSSLDLSAPELSPPVVPLSLPTCSPVSHLPGWSAAERAAMYRTHVPSGHLTGKHTPQPPTLHPTYVQQPTKPQTTNYMEQISDFTKSYKCDNSTKQNVFSPEVTFSDTRNSKTCLPFGEYPEQRSDTQGKMKCKSRSGKSCFCVECLTRKWLDFHKMDVPWHYGLPL